MPGVATPEGYTHAPVADRQPEPAKDPLQITLDLRNLSPARWGAGAKSFAVVLLLVGAFILGGYAGAAFERTRDELGAGIGDIKELGSGEQDADAAAGDTGDADEGDGNLDVGDGSGTGNGTGDGLGNTSDDGDANTTDPDDPPDDPPPDDGSGETRIVLAETGQGDATTDTFTTNQDLLRFSIRFETDDPAYAFRVSLWQDGATRPERTLSASEAGSYITERYASVPAGLYHLEVNISPDGYAPPWEIFVEEPAGEDAAGAPQAFSGRGDGVSGPVWMEGSHTVAIDAPGFGRLDVRAYSEDGTWLQDCHILASSTNDPSGSATCAVAERTKVYFDVVAPSDSNPWSLDIS